MISEFELLAHKVERLAQLTHALRLENAQLRRNAASVLADNKDLQQRMLQAHERVAALLAQLPDDLEVDEEAA